LIFLLVVFTIVDLSQNAKKLLGIAFHLMWGQNSFPCRTNFPLTLKTKLFCVLYPMLMNYKFFNFSRVQTLYPDLCEPCISSNPFRFFFPSFRGFPYTSALIGLSWIPEVASMQMLGVFL
jgi:hypothetical protein